MPSSAGIDESAGGGATLVLGAQHPFPPFITGDRGSSATAVGTSNAAAVSTSTRLNTSAVVGSGSYEGPYENGVRKWTRCEELGRGAHGIVYRGVVEDTGGNIAVKQFQRSGAGRADLQAAENEIGLLPRLRHPNVVRFLGIERAGEHLNIFLEYLDGGSLRKRLEKDGPMSEEQAANTTRKVLSGLSYLHSKDITHRDIKGANVLLSKNGAVKLADFGTSKLMDQASVVSGLKGTPKWMAPEVIRNQLRPGGWLQADVWSVGCTVVEMLTGKVPWPDMPHPVSAMYKIGLGEKPPIDRYISPEASSFIAACCCPEPSQRYTVEQLMKHPFLARSRSPPGGVMHAACPSSRPQRFEDGNRQGGGPWTPTSADGRSPREWRWQRPQPTNTPPSSRSASGGENDIISRGGGYGRDAEGWDENKAATEDETGGDDQGGTFTRRPPCRSRETAKSKQSRWPRKAQRDWNGDNVGGAEADQSQVGRDRGQAECWRGNAVGSPVRTTARVRASPRIAVDSAEAREAAAAENMLTRGEGDRRRRRQKQQQTEGQGTSDMRKLLDRGMRCNGDRSSTSAALVPATPRPLGPTYFSSPICQSRYNGSPSKSDAALAPKFEETPIGCSSSPGGGGAGDGAEWTWGNSSGGKDSPRDGDANAGSGSGSGSGSDGRGSPLENRYIDRDQKSNVTNTFSKPQNQHQQHQQQRQQQHQQQHQYQQHQHQLRQQHQQQQYQHQHQHQHQHQQELFPERYAISVPEPESPSGLAGGGLPPTFTDSWNHISCYGGNQSEEEEEEEDEEQQQDLNIGADMSRLSMVDRRSRVVSYNSPIVTSPVVTLGRQTPSRVLTGTGTNQATEFDDSGRRPSGSSNNASSRWGSAYKRPFQVVKAAREDVMGRGGATDQARPDGPITGEYIKLEKQRGLRVPTDGSVPDRSGRGRWRSNSMPSQSMRTKSAGVLGASAKLPPLERDVPGGGAAGGRGGGGRGGGVGGFRNASVGMRLVTSAPTPVESFLPTAPTATSAAAAKLPVMGSKGPVLACSMDRRADQSADRSAARSTDRSMVDRHSTEVISDDPYTAAADLPSSSATAVVARTAVTGSPRQEGMLRRRANLAPIRTNMYSASPQASGMYSPSTPASGVYSASTPTSGALAAASVAAMAAGTDDRASIARSTGGGGERSGGARGAGGVGDGGFPSRAKSTTSPLSAWGSARALFPDATDDRIFSGIHRERVRMVGSGGNVARGSGDDGCHVTSRLSGQASTSAVAASAASAASTAAASSLHCSSFTTGPSG